MRYLLWQQKLGEWHPDSFSPPFGTRLFFLVQCSRPREIRQVLGASRCDPSGVIVRDGSVFGCPGDSSAFLSNAQRGSLRFSHVCWMSRLARGDRLSKRVPIFNLSQSWRIKYSLPKTGMLTCISRTMCFYLASGASQFWLNVLNGASLCNESHAGAKRGLPWLTFILFQFGKHLK